MHDLSNGISTIFFHANLACAPLPLPIHCGECWIASCWRSREKNTETVCTGGEKEAWTNGARVQSSSVQPTARKVNSSIRNRPFVSCYLDREMAIFKAGTGYFQPRWYIPGKKIPSCKLRVVRLRRASRRNSWSLNIDVDASMDLRLMLEGNKGEKRISLLLSFLFSYPPRRIALSIAVYQWPQPLLKITRFVLNEYFIFLFHGWFSSLFLSSDQVNIVLKAGYNRTIDIGVVWDLEEIWKFFDNSGIRKIRIFWMADRNFVARVG